MKNRRILQIVKLDTKFFSGYTIIAIFNFATHNLFSFVSSSPSAYFSRWSSDPTEY